ncbi:condensation domain-containing protein [Paenibacillus tengchongensis]|uniref:condensation domain-containing protein n=1 Tax=Paenibacillus tengchongensis TaxID=2608684 RepID=UPI00124D0538|nr:condensation domain-containing protein [Paenibacillus tengchongensis]
MENTKEKIKALSREQLLELMARSKGQKQSPAIGRADRSAGSFSQSYSQQRQWFMEQLMNGGVFNVPQSYLLKGKVRIDLLEEALNKLVEKHESLRTVFNTVDYIPSQIIKPYERFRIEHIDLQAYGSGEQQEKLREINREIARRPFDLTVGPLWRFQVIRLAEEEVVLTLSLHHIICDGWSFGVIMQELAEGYSGLLSGQADVRPLPVQYADYSEWQRQRIESGELDDQLNYWLGKLQDGPACIALPYDYRRGDVQTYRGRTEYFTVDRETAGRIHELALGHKSSVYHLMLSALSLLLHAYSLDETICIGTPVAGRSRVELEKLIGLFINTVVIRSRLEPELSFTALLEEVKGNCIEAFNHAEIPFEQVVTGLQLQRQMRHSPLFQVLYVQTEESMLNVTIPGINAEVIPVTAETAQFDLSLYATVLREGISAGFEYNTDLFSRETILRMIEDFQVLLKAATADPDRSIAELAGLLGRKKLALTIVSSFESEPVAEALEYWLDRLAVPAKLQFAPYSQVFQQLIDASSLLSGQHGGIGVVLLRLEDWIQGMDFPKERLEAVLAENTARFIQSLLGHVNRHRSPLLLVLCPASERILGQPGLSAQIAQLEAQITGKAAGNRYITVLQGQEIAWKYGLTEYNDGLGDEEGHVPYLREYFTALGTELARIMLELSLQAPSRR